MTEQKPTIIAASRWSQGGSPEYPMRMVLMWNEQKKEWCLTYQGKKPDGEVYQFWGKYMMCPLEEALRVFLARLDTHNANYPNGNISHTFGIDFIHYQDHRYDNRTDATMDIICTITDGTPESHIAWARKALEAAVDYGGNTWLFQPEDGVLPVICMAMDNTNFLEITVSAVHGNQLEGD